MVSVGGKDIAANGLRFHPEAPLNAAERESLDRHRLDPVIRVVGAQLSDWFDRLNDARHGGTEHPPATVMGLLGGLGQGKSTVLHAVLEQVERRWISRDFGIWLRTFPQPAMRPFVRRPRLLRIDTSLTKAKDIESKLFGLLLFPHLAWGVVRGAVLLSAVAYLIPSALMSTESLHFLFDCVLSGPGLGLLGLAALSPIASLGKELGKDWYGNLSDVVVFKLARFLLVTPELLVIDDLDRAKVEQQRAVLRALYKHARMLRCAVVVCFDEQELLANKVEPDSPDELLRKVLNFSVRIPPRTQEDALLLATGICEDWGRRNPSQPLSGAVAAPEFAAYLARAAWLLDQVGPRRIKDLLAHALMMAVARGVVSATELIALLRLASLYQMLPEAKSDGEALIRLLERNRQEEFGAYLNSRVKDDTLRSKVLRFLRRTRAQQPEELGWRALLGLEQTYTAVAPPMPTKDWKPALWRVKTSIAALPEAEHARKFCLDVHEELEHVRAGYRPTEVVIAKIVTTVLSAEGPGDEAALGMFLLGAAVEDDATARLALYRYWWKRLRESTVPDDARRRCVPVCLREWVADEDVWRLLTDQERRSLLEPPEDAIATSSLHGLGLLVAPVDGDFPLLLRFALKHFKTQEHLRQAAELLRAMPVKLGPLDLDDIGDMKEALHLLGRVWPPLMPIGANPLQSVHIPLLALGAIQERAGTGLLPDGVIGGLDYRGPFDPQNWVPGMRGLLKPGEGWRLEYWHDRWRGHMPKPLKDWIGQGCSPQYPAGLDLGDVLTLVALCIADEFWQGLDKLLPMPKGTLLHLDPDVRIANALASDPAIAEAMPEWTWFWLDLVPDSEMDVRKTLQARLIEAILMHGNGRHLCRFLAQLYLREYEALALAPEAPGEADRRRHLINGIYETYFRDSGTTEDASDSGVAPL